MSATTAAASTTSSSSLEEYLQKVLVRDLIDGKKRKEIISTTTTASIQDAIQLLARHRILAVPVRDEIDGPYVGWFSVLDALDYVLKTYSKGETVDKDAPWSTWCRDIDTLTHRKIELGKINVEVAMDKTWYTPVSAFGSVLEIVEFFASKKTIHRIAVCNNEDDKIVRAIITQSDVINHLYKHSFDFPGILGYFGNTTIGKIDGLKKYAICENLVSMSIHAETIHAFWLINFDKVHGVPIVDSNGKLVANISASDIKGISSGELPFSSLLLPIKDFIHKAHLRPPIKCMWDTHTFSSILQMLALYRVHRVWVVDTNDIPVGVITLTTIMNFLKDLAK